MGAIRFVVYSRNLQLEYARVLYKELLVPVPSYGSEPVVWVEKERSRIRATQNGKLRYLLSIIKIDKSAESTDKGYVWNNYGVI